MKVALSHDWLNGMRGGEKCLEVFCELFPGSPLYTLFYEKGKVSETIVSHPIKVSPLQGVPGIFKRYRFYLPFFPWAVASLKPQDNTDLLISTNHCVAKGVKKPKKAVHICYCFTPMRYAWGFFEDYFGGRSRWQQFLVKVVLARLKKWDLKVNKNVDHFVAISEHIKKRIERNYNREAMVIYPPVDTDFFMADEKKEREDFYLIVSALVPYKAIDLAIEAFNQSKKKLVIIGDGPSRAELESMARENITFLGWKSNEVLRDHYRRAQALVFPGEEDFGIVPVEAQGCGAPVIAFAAGGALETVIDGVTGVFFREATADSLLDALQRLEKLPLNAQDAVDNAQKFSKERFKNEMCDYIKERVAQ